MSSDTYAALARYYDLIYQWKNYKLEAEKIRWLITKTKRSGGRSLLDVACGTGGHVSFLKQRYEVVGIDKSASMIQVARRKIARVPFHAADMRTFRLGRNFDVVICLFSAIAYMKTRRDLGKAIATMASHLKPGGVLIVEPFVPPGKFNPTRRHPVEIATSKTTALVRMTEARQRGRSALFDFHLLVKENHRISYFVDRHELYLFSQKEYLSAFKRHGLQAKFLKQGLTPDRGLYVATKPL